MQVNKKWHWHSKQVNFVFLLSACDTRRKKQNWQNTHHPSIDDSSYCQRDEHDAGYTWGPALHPVTCNSKQGTKEASNQTRTQIGSPLADYQSERASDAMLTVEPAIFFS
jgi:hypothetical protein